MRHTYLRRVLADIRGRLLMRIAISLLLMVVTTCGCSTRRNASAIHDHVTNGTYINEPLSFGLRLAEGWSIVPTAEIERAATRANECHPAEQALLTAVKKDDEGSAIMVCLLSPARPEQIFANTALKFAQDNATGTVERVSINGLELLHRQYYWKHDGSAWRSDLYTCDKPCGTLGFLLTQDENKQIGSSDRLLREMLTTGCTTHERIRNEDLALVARLKAAIVPSVEFRDAPFHCPIAFCEAALNEFYTPTNNWHNSHVFHVDVPEAVWSEIPRITVSATNISVYSMVIIISAQTGCEVMFKNGAVRFKYRE